MSIEVVTPTSEAASPTHPEHPRWVKEQMLARRMAWLKSIGIEAKGRHEEQVVDHGMQRLEARNRHRKPVIVKSAPEPERNPNRNAAHAIARDAGYTFTQRNVGRVRDQQSKADRRARGRAAAALARASHDFECGRCGKCVRCKRELRCQNLLRAGRASGPGTRLYTLAMMILSAGMAANAKLGKFAGLAKHDVDRLLTRILEDVCDQSTAIAGAWR